LTPLLTAIAEIDDFTDGMNSDEFATDKKTINAVIRSLEVLGEATKHIPAPFRKKHPTFPGARWPACAMSLSTTT